MPAGKGLVRCAFAACTCSSVTSACFSTSKKSSGRGGCVLAGTAAWSFLCPVRHNSLLLLLLLAETFHLLQAVVVLLFLPVQLGLEGSLCSDQGTELLRSSLEVAAGFVQLPLWRLALRPPRRRGPPGSPGFVRFCEACLRTGSATSQSCFTASSVSSLSWVSFSLHSARLRPAKPRGAGGAAAREAWRLHSWKVLSWPVLLRERLSLGDLVLVHPGSARTDQVRLCGHGTNYWPAG